jgi:hypothetical protein
MHYFLFNNDVFVSTGGEIERLNAEKQKTFAFGSVRTAHVCVVDVDVLVAVAPEERPEQRDVVLAKEFTRVHPGEYIIQEERIAANMFQVVCVKTEKARDIYKRLPGDRIITFTPYAMAVRAFLNTQNLDPRSIVAFVDDLEGETLITFYEGLKFSQTRRFNESDIEKILPEIKRSAIGFTKTIKRENDSYLIITNNLTWASLIESFEPDQEVRYVESKCPAIEGLKMAHFPLKFELPEEVLKRSKENELKAKIPYFAIAAAFVVFGMCYVLFYRICLSIQTSSYEHVQSVRDSLEDKLGVLDRRIYRSALKSQKSLNYGDIYLCLQSVIPQSYEVDSLVFTSKDQKRYLEIVLSLQKGQPYEDIPVRKPFTRMTVQNVLVKDRPGKSIRIEL